MVQEGIQDNSCINKKERNSNIELLRIIAMIMIVVHHIAIYTKTYILEDLSATSYIGIYMFAAGKLGVNIFILISGYFLINSKFDFKRIIKLWVQIAFYSITIMLILKGFNIIKISKGEMIKFFLPVSYGKYWFASVYMYLYLLSPFINKFAQSINEKTYKNLLIIATIIFSVIYSVCYKSNAFQAGTGIFESLSWFVYMYLLAGYIRIYGIKFLENKKRIIIITIITIATFILMLSMFHFVSIKFDKFTELTKVINYYTRMNSIFQLILSVLILYTFINWHIKKTKIINFLGQTSFAVYLLHEHESLRVPLWSFIKNVIAKYDMNIIEISVIFIIAFWVVASLIEIVRKKILEENVLKIKKISKICEKINKSMDISK